MPGTRAEVETATRAHLETLTEMAGGDMGLRNLESKIRLVNENISSTGDNSPLRERWSELLAAVINREQTRAGGGAAGGAQG